METLFLAENEIARPGLQNGTKMNLVNAGVSGRLVYRINTYSIPVVSHFYLYGAFTNRSLIEVFHSKST